ncbi:sensor domain-containing diguanylate cyclase [Roseibium sp. M-1]
MFETQLLSDAFAVVSVGGTVMFGSPAFARLVAGGKDVSLSGTGIDQWLEPLDISAFTPAQEVLAVTTGRFRHPQSCKTFVCKVKPLSDGGNTAGSMIFLLPDDGQQNDIRALYPHAFDLNPGLSAITVLATGEHLDVNQAWLEALEFERAEVIGRTATELGVWEGGAPYREEIVRQLLLNGKIENLGARMRTKTGKTLHIIISAKVIEHRGRLFSFFSSHDVTKVSEAHRHQLTLEREIRSWQNIACIDELTGVANRRQFDTVLEQEWRRCGRNRRPLSLLLIDIDQFKQFNDHYGHVAGDSCLHEVAQALNLESQRAGDLFFRFGGEEFGCLLPETDLQGATVFGDRLLKTVRKLRLRHEKSSVSPFVTISIGAASLFPNEQSGPKLLVEAADKNLYRAKSSGRNMLV